MISLIWWQQHWWLLLLKHYGRYSSCSIHHVLSSPSSLTINPAFFFRIILSDLAAITKHLSKLTVECQMLHQRDRGLCNRSTSGIAFIHKSLLRCPHSFQGVVHCTLKCTQTQTVFRTTCRLYRCSNIQSRIPYLLKCK